ncbi:ribosomal-protein-alanine N-acetyltransferase [Hydrogenovibrio sp. SC-1]|uniref:ribosomal protein S18-alanine N-acetyltransferase n=1 Tax=Hydrogenovibrio sp. SC-1 TaxID=2065820 RepID=UPI000C7DB5F9|nr:ribosomal protein S18-alanine N-acetyltransferase [Hydrogenovibrio sp. SC-1]PLA75509.1 ribosomal-protein-alanine N-acetyltransferase [Hydrogenovibrio sp. SC-1]
MKGYDFFRPMTELDLDWVLSIEQQAYDFPWSRRGFEQALDDGLAYVFCDAQQHKLGYACFLTVLDEVHLLNFCVAPKCQRQGIGRVALQALQKHFCAANYQIMLLEVRVSNAAIGLYESLGFVQNGIRPNYYAAWDYQDGELVKVREDALLMSCALKTD